MPLTSPTTPTQPTALSSWWLCVGILALFAVAVGLATLWVSPPVVDRASAAWLFAASAALGGSGLFTVFAARGEVRRLERELRREKAAAAWREDAAHDDLLDDDGDTSASEEAAPSIHDLRAAFDAAGDAMIILDADLWVIASNPAATDALGAAAAVETRWDERNVWPSPITQQRVPLPTGGQLIIGRDSAQERLRAAQLDRMDGAVDLAGMIVHDVNNALGAVAGYADFLVADLPAGSPEADFAARILSATDRSKTTLRRVLSAARDLAVEIRPVPSAAVLNETDRLLRMTRRPGLSLRDEAGHVDGLGDGGLIVRCLAGLANDLGGDSGAEGEKRAALILRALRWGGGEDALKAPAGWACQPILPPHRRPHLLFELRAPAPPPSMAALRALIDPLLAAREHARAGAGDRPPSALALARALDGGLILWTHPAEGTVLRLFVPMTPSSLAAAPRPALADARHVLVVDEVRETGDRLSIGLERQGYEVAVCESAADALEILVDEPGFFDVAVVAGPSAGGMPGLSLIGRLKELRPDLPCILYTDQPVDGDPARVAASGVDRVLSKPIDMERLSRSIAALLPPPKGVESPE
ncbi:response regulator [Azospirillum sp.]|uniref:response regulator n=1 Tax=Azospirillum sp. TaxID=34012 RepID=UPI0026289103|nr:response regulator [Azospirillum sp.]